MLIATAQLWRSQTPTTTSVSGHAPPYEVEVGTTAKTSSTHPLIIAEVVAPRGGLVGITFCPGKVQVSALSGAWARDLDLDLSAIRAWGAGVLVTLVTAAEMKELQVEGLGAGAKALGLNWLHLPIIDVSTPTAEWERSWVAERGAVHAELDRGGKVLIHCKGGLGRAGTVAARVLIERGMSAGGALAAVRKARPGAVETRAQEDYIFAISNGAERASQ